MVLIAAATGWISVSLLKETYTPTILRKRAKQKRRETGDDRYFSRFDDKQGFWPLLRVNLSRPFVMMVTEPIWYVVSIADLTIINANAAFSGTSTLR